MAGRPKKKWLRFYTKTIHNTLLRGLPPAQRWVWMTALALAGDSPQRGILLLEDSVPATLRHIADAAAVPPKDAKAAVQTFLTAGMMTEAGGVYSIVNWDEYQYESDDVAKRTAAHYQRSKERSNNDGFERSNTPQLERSNNGSDGGNSNVHPRVRASARSVFSESREQSPESQNPEGENPTPSPSSGGDSGAREEGPPPPRLEPVGAAVRPTMAEVQAVFDTAGRSDLAKAFYNRYASVGWVKAGAPIVDLVAAVDDWIGKQPEFDAKRAIASARSAVGPRSLTDRFEGIQRVLGGN